MEIKWICWNLLEKSEIIFGGFKPFGTTGGGGGIDVGLWWWRCKPWPLASALWSPPLQSTPLSEDVDTTPCRPNPGLKERTCWAARTSWTNRLQSWSCPSEAVITMSVCALTSMVCPAIRSSGTLWPRCKTMAGAKITCMLTWKKIVKLTWSFLCLQQFDKFSIWSEACNDRKRQSGHHQSYGHVVRRWPVQKSLVCWPGNQ